MSEVALNSNLITSLKEQSFKFLKQLIHSNSPSLTEDEAYRQWILPSTKDELKFFEVKRQVKSAYQELKKHSVRSYLVQINRMKSYNEKRVLIFTRNFLITSIRENKELKLHKIKDEVRLSRDVEYPNVDNDLCVDFFRLIYNMMFDLVREFIEEEDINTSLHRMLFVDAIRKFLINYLEIEGYNQDVFDKLQIVERGHQVLGHQLVQQFRNVFYHLKSEDVLNTDYYMRIFYQLCEAKHLSSYFILALKDCSDIILTTQMEFYIQAIIGFKSHEDWAGFILVINPYYSQKFNELSNTVKLDEYYKINENYDNKSDEIIDTIYSNLNKSKFIDCTLDEFKTIFTSKEAIQFKIDWKKKKTQLKALLNLLTDKEIEFENLSLKESEHGGFIEGNKVNKIGALHFTIKGKEVTYNKLADSKSKLTYKDDDCLLAIYKGLINIVITK